MKCNLLINACGLSLPAIKNNAAALYRNCWNNGAILEEPRAVIFFGREDNYGELADILPVEDVLLLELGVPTAACAAGALIPRADRNTLYLLGNDDMSRELAARLAAALGGSAIPDANGLDFENGRPICSRLIYSGHMEGIFRLERPPYFVCLNGGGQVNDYTAGCGRNVEFFSIPDTEGQYAAFSSRVKAEPRTENAAFLIAAGNGIRDGVSLDQLRELAEVMGGTVAVSRALSVRPYAGNEPVLGISGTSSAARVCFAVGVSGASAFFAGIERCGFIAAVNTDENAPIISKCDCAAFEDYGPVISELLAIAGRKGSHA